MVYLRRMVAFPWWEICNDDCGFTSHVKSWCFRSGLKLMSSKDESTQPYYKLLAHAVITAHNAFRYHSVTVTILTCFDFQPSHHILAKLFLACPSPLGPHVHAEVFRSTLPIARVPTALIPPANICVPESNDCPFLVAVKRCKRHVRSVLNSPLPTHEATRAKSRRIFPRAAAAQTFRSVPGGRVDFRQSRAGALCAVVEKLYRSPDV